MNNLSEVNKKYNRLLITDIVIEKIGNEPKNRTVAICRCDCGNIKKVRLSHLKQEKVKSCGCLRNELSSERWMNHGFGDTLLCAKYHAMMSRCYNENNKAYKRYGGRGISVCEEWKNDFMKFYQWAISNSYQRGLTLDRIDNNGNYGPENCRFVDTKTQNRNKDTVHTVTAFGETKYLSDWSNDRRCMVGGNMILRRIRDGFTAEEAITLPHMNKFNYKKILSEKIGEP